MDRLLVESAIRGTLIAASVGGVLWATRMKAPALLHAIWTCVVIAMLLLPLWTIWGPKASMQVLPRQEPASAVVIEAPAPLTSVSTSRVDGTPSPLGQRRGAASVDWNWRDVVTLVYGVVAGVLLMRLAIGTLRTRRLVRRSIMNHGRLTSAACASPVTVGWLRPVVILPEAWREWSHSKLDAVLTHEHAHARRRDPLVQWLALLNRAVFWFHPLAWWLERRLSVLAEQTCDDAVLARGHDPQDYSEYLLDTARSLGRGGRVNLAGAFMAGTFLPQRIRRILDGTSSARVSRARRILAVTACVAAAAFCLVATPVRALSQRGAIPSRLIVRPVQPRGIPPDSTLPQPVSLEWLDGDEWAFEVQSILTSEEMREYADLREAKERDAFIERFWARRDPSPGTPPNEFRDEFIRRVQFARERFADPKSAAMLGFDTDRGRVYLMFGPPDSIVTRAAGADQIDEWRYTDIAAIGGDFRVRFSSTRGTYCGYRIVSPAPIATVGGAGAASVPAVQFYPFGLVAISIPVEAARVAGARWELRNRQGVQVDGGEIGFMEGPASDQLSRHLSASWLEMGIGCTQALPANSYTLTTAVRFVTGQLQSETVTFNVE